MKIEKLIEKTEDVIDEDIVSINRINSGYSRDVYSINNKYILKICKDDKKSQLTLNEINFLEGCDLDYTPRLIYKDLSKEIIPHIYHIESLVSGKPLLFRWDKLTTSEKENILSQLLRIIEDLHSKNFDESHNYYLSSFISEYNQYLDRLVDKEMLTADKIKHLKEIREIIPRLFENAKKGLIHGDLYFNNIMIDSDNKLSLIDFERVKNSYVDRDFDPINRMARNPNSFLKEDEKEVNADQFLGIIPYIENNSNEITDEFMDRLLFFDCMNSLRWLYRYPKHAEYEDILFNKSKKLLK